MTGAAFLDLTRGVLAVSGPLRQKFLHNLLSNDVESVQPGHGRLASLMDARGRILALMRVLVAKDAVLLELPADRVAPVRALLEHYRVGAPVRFAEPPLAVLAMLGAGARECVTRAGAELPELGPEAHVETTLGGAGVRVSRASDLPASALVVHVAPESIAAMRAALQGAGAATLEAAAFDALRVEEGRPLFGIDVTDDNLLHETGLIAEYHSPSKGCYIGQETVARLEARGGNVNKALRGLRLGQPSVPGAPIQAGAKDVGRITTAAVSERFGPIAMGYVHRDHFAPGSAVTVAGSPATVVALPFPQ